VNVTEKQTVTLVHVSDFKGGDALHCFCSLAQKSLVNTYRPILWPDPNCASCEQGRSDGGISVYIPSPKIKIKSVYLTNFYVVTGF